jgi:hypothetical protein
MTGAVDQFIDSTDATGEPRLLRSVISAQLQRLSTLIATFGAVIPSGRSRLAERQRPVEGKRHDFQTSRTPRPSRANPVRNPDRAASTARRHFRQRGQVVSANWEMAAATSRRLRCLLRPAISRCKALGRRAAGRTWSPAKPLHRR